MRLAAILSLTTVAFSAILGKSFEEWPPGVYCTSNSVLTALISKGCSLDSVILKLANTTLPDPPSGQKLLFVGAGRGTQNYTCDTHDPSSTPAAIGAIAILYDAGCAAARFPEVFDLIPDILLQYSGLSSMPSNVLSFSDANVLGHHYFSGSTTPVFNLSSSGELVVAKKIESSNAPSGSPAGQASATSPGAVAWLFLQSQSGTIGKIKSVYRTGTAGGMQPATCVNQPAEFTVEYAAKYFFYG